VDEARLDRRPEVLGQRLAAREPHVDERSGAPLFEEAELAQQLQVVADARLRHRHGARELADRQLLAGEQPEDPQARRVGEQLQDGSQAGFHGLNIITS